MKILVNGWYGHQNLGDESYKESFRLFWPQHDLVFSDSFRKTETGFDAQIVGGGDIIRPELLRNVFKRSDIPAIAMSVTITEQSLCPELSMFSRIVVRDVMSLSLLEKYGITKIVPCSMIPDASIVLKGRPDVGKSIIRRMFLENGLDEPYKNVHVVALNAHLLFGSNATIKNGMYFDILKYVIAEIADETNASFVFMPYSVSNPWDDRIPNSLAVAHTKWWKKHLVIWEKLPIQQSLDIISAADFMITTRFHGLIFGVGNNVPTLPISFHDKTKGFCDTVDITPLDYYNTTTESLRKAISKTKAVNFDTSSIIDAYRKELHLLGQ
jgi:polysaccharide pyruvyl transferase WcaK-like protein